MSLLLLYRPRVPGGDTHDGGEGGSYKRHHIPQPLPSVKKKAKRVPNAEATAKRVVLVHSATLELSQKSFEQGKRDYDRIQAEILKIQEEIRLLKLAPPIDTDEDRRLLEDLEQFEAELKLLELKKMAIARALLDDEIIIMLLSDQEIH